MEKKVSLQRSWTVIGSLVIILASITTTTEFQNILKVTPSEWLPIITTLISIIMILKRVFWPTGCPITKPDDIPPQVTLHVDDITITTEIPHEISKL